MGSNPLGINGIHSIGRMDGQKTRLQSINNENQGIPLGGGEGVPKLLVK